MSDKLNDVYSAAFDNDCSDVLNDMVAYVGLNPVCPRNIAKHTFDVYHYFDTNVAMEMTLHEITHFVWFLFWQKHFQDSVTEYECPQIKWLLSEIVVETIIRNSIINSLIKLPKYIAYSYFYDIKINDVPIFDSMKKTVYWP